MDARQALLEGLFDHAGTFPPAAKSFEDALHDAATFGSTLANPSLVGADMVLNKVDLDKLDDDALEAAGWTGERACTVCLVGVPASRAEGATKHAIQWNEEGAAARLPRRIVAIELTFDSDLSDGVESVASCVTAARHRLRGSEIGLFIEPRWNEDAWTEDGLARVASLLDAFGDDTELDPVGLKVRCAGPTALGPDALATVLAVVAERGLPFKATQGLHHPVAGDDGPVGFLGLTVGLRMAQARGLRGDELAACVGESDAGAFGFDGGVTWRDHHVALGDLGEALQEVPFSIGSCSLTEPDEDLQRLA